MSTPLFEKNVAISGIGQSEVGRPSNRSAMQLSVAAALEAIADAGLTRDDIDGISCWPGDNDNGSPFSPVGPNALIGDDLHARLTPARFSALVETAAAGVSTMKAHLA